MIRDGWPGVLPALSDFSCCSAPCAGGPRWISDLPPPIGEEKLAAQDAEIEERERKAVVSTGTSRQQAGEVERVRRIARGPPPIRDSHVQLLPMLKAFLQILLFFVDKTAGWGRMYCARGMQDNA